MLIYPCAELYSLLTIFHKFYSLIDIAFKKGHILSFQFSMKNFDMVFVFKDYTRKIVMASLIPMTSLDSVKDWLK